MIEIKKESWHCQLYLFMLSSLEGFFKDNMKYCRHQQQTNLCHYMRVLLVYCPLLTLWWVGVPLGSLALLFGLPLSELGVSGTLVAVAALALALGAVAGLAYSVVKACDWVVESQEQRRLSKGKAPGEPILFIRYIQAIHRGICPLVSLVDNQEETSHEA